MDILKRLSEKDPNFYLFPQKTIRVEIPLDFDDRTAINKEIRRLTKKPGNVIENFFPFSNFCEPTHVFLPGMTYDVELYQAERLVSVKNTISFLRNKESLFLGARGLATFLLAAKNGDLPTLQNIYFLDLKEKLLCDKNDIYYAPRCYQFLDGNIHISSIDYHWSLIPSEPPEIPHGEQKRKSDLVAVVRVVPKNVNINIFNFPSRSLAAQAAERKNKIQPLL